MLSFIAKVQSLYKHIFSRIYIVLHEHSYGKKGKYLFINNHSDKLLVVFSAFTGEHPRYNYFYSFRDLKRISQLYILDNYGKKGSYYLYEDGDNYPEKDVLSLIDSIINTFNFKTVITAGTSKGGSAAIYFGLKVNADAIFSGACQYYIGSYLNRTEHEEILKAMKGSIERKIFVDYLDNALKNVIVEYKNSHGEIYLLYSKNELTYERQTIYLLEELKKNRYDFEERIETFTDHSIVGKYFVPYIRNMLDVKFGE